MLLAGLGSAACDLFGDKKKPLPGERISVLGLDRRNEPDPQLANVPITLPGATVNPEWPEPGGTPNHAMGHLALAENPQRIWRSSVGDGSARYRKVMSQPVIAKGRAFAMDGGVQVSALDANSGDRVWRVDLKPEELRGNAFGGGPSFWNDRLYVSTGYAQVVALDPADGKEIWRQGVSAPIHSAPTVVDGRVFVVTVENELNALSATDGKRLWTHNGIPETAGLLGSSSPAVDGDAVARCAALMRCPPWLIFTAGRSLIMAASLPSATVAAWWRSICAVATGFGNKTSPAAISRGSPVITSSS